jgi:hypothetical protein
MNKLIESLEQRCFFSSTWATAINAELAGSIDQRLVPGKSVEMFSAGNYSAGTGYVRNADFWAGNLTLAESVWNSAAGQNMSGTLITPQDIIYANHYAYGKDTIVRWIDAKDNVIDRRVVSYQTVPDCDVVVAHLDAPIDPDVIPFVQIAGDNLGGMVTGADNMPIVITNQFNEGFVYDVMSYSVFSSEHVLTSFQPNQFMTGDPNRPNYTGKIIPGDSGDPLMMAFNNRPILLAHLTWGNSSGTMAGGFSYSSFASEINAAIAANGSTFRLSVFDPADLNADGQVDSRDFTILAQSFNTAQPVGSSPDAKTLFSDADINLDGRINALDFNALATEYGTTSPI